MLYADDITITSTHTSMSAARKYIHPYLHKVSDCTQHNNLIISPEKNTCTLFTPDPAEYNSNLGLNINNKALPMALHPKVLCLTLDPKLIYNARIQNIASHAQNPLHVIKALTGTSAGPEVRRTADVGWRSLFLLPINPPRTYSRLYHHMCTQTDGR